MTVPAWRYHATEDAKLFVTEDELVAAEAQGWRDSPGAALTAIDNIDVELQAAALAGDAAYKAITEAAPQAEAAKDAIEEAQKVVAKKRKR